MALYPEALDLTAISLCSGSGALDLALELAVPALRPLCYVEREAFAAATLVQAIEAGYLASAPVWSDTRTFRGRRFRGLVAFVYGGIPCQPHSEAGPALGAADERDLWPDARRIIVQTGAWGVFLENVGGMLHTGGAYRVFRGLRRLGYQVAGGLFTASEVGGSHERERLFILAVHDGLAALAAARSQFDAGDGSGALGALAVADADRTGPPQRLRRPGHPPEEQAATERGGGALGDAAGERRRQGRRGSEVRARQSPAGQSGGPMGDAHGRGYRGRAVEPIRAARWGTVDPWSGPSAAFPPRPGDLAGWGATLALWPHLEPVICGKPYELASRLERARSWTTHARSNRLDRLRLLGGGVVPLAAAYAFRALATELARTSSGATQLVRVMPDNRHNYTMHLGSDTNAQQA